MFSFRCKSLTSLFLFQSQDPTSSCTRHNRLWLPKLYHVLIPPSPTESNWIQMILLLCHSIQTWNTAIFLCSLSRTTWVTDDDKWSHLEHSNGCPLLNSYFQILFSRNLMISQKLLLLDAFSVLWMVPKCICGRGCTPEPNWGSLQLFLRPPSQWRGARCHLPKNPTPTVGFWPRSSALWASHFGPLCLKPRPFRPCILSLCHDPLQESITFYQPILPVTGRWTCGELKVMIMLTTMT